MARGNGEKGNKISAYLLKQEVDQPEQALRNREELLSISLPVGELSGDFYWKKPKEDDDPPWRDFLENLPQEVADQLKSRSASAALFVPIASRWFAVCFGFGHTLLDTNAIEPEFGFRAGLPAIDPEGIKTIEGSSLDRTGSNRRVHVATPSSFFDLGLDSEHNLITSVSGRSKSQTKGGQIHGRDAFQWWAKMSLADLPEKLKEWLEVFQTTNLEETHPDWRKMRPVKDVSLIAKLDEEIVLRLKANPRDRVWIAIPHAVDWDLTEGFRYGLSRSQPILPDIDIESFCTWFGDLDRLTVDSLKKEEVVAVQVSGINRRWKIYKCIYAEVEQEGLTFVLMNGLWLSVNNDFIEQTNLELAGRWKELNYLPTLNENEKEYNRKAASVGGGRFLTLDCKCITHGGGQSKLEVCDLLDTAEHGQLIHVKCYGNSRVLSYLFDQGIVSARCLSEHKAFRQKVAALLPDEHKNIILNMPSEKPGIVYAIATKKETLDEKGLPFFSRVILASYIRELEGRGFSVTLGVIRDARERHTPKQKRHKKTAPALGTAPV